MTLKNLLVRFVLLAMQAVIFVCLLSLGVAKVFAQCQATGSCPNVCNDNFPPSNGPSDFCRYPNTGCPDDLIAQGGFYANHCCYSVTPILIDTIGEGFSLTDLANGVLFPMNPSSGHLYRVSWTAPGSGNAWLALDVNHDGKIGNIYELFGNFTEQPTPPVGEGKNGFLALAAYDKREKGGNENGVIDSGDQIFSKLLLWTDRNHNGESESGELANLSASNIAEISLDYKPSRRVDRFGNRFAFRSRLKLNRGASEGRFAWDVIPRLSYQNSSVETSSLLPITK